MIEVSIKKEAKALEKRGIVGEELERRLEERRKQMMSESPCIGGRAFEFLPKVIVELRMVEEGSPEREAYLFKIRGGKSGGTARFKLSDLGIEGV